MSAEQSPSSLLTLGTQVEEFTIVDILGHGGYGEVYQVINQSNEVYAMKVEKYRPNMRGLSLELSIMQLLKGECFTEIVKKGLFKINPHSDDILQYMVMKMYLFSLCDLRKVDPSFIIEFSAHKKSAPYHIALRTLKIIHKLHECGVVHLDIKPANFLFNKNSDEPIVLIDFGLSMLKSEVGVDSKLFVGTKRYASVNCHKKKPLGPTDDLISWFFVFIELYYGSLPWRNIKEKVDVMVFKENEMENVIGTSKNFMKIYEYLSNLQINEHPDYEYVEFLLRNEMEKEDIPLEFDWDEFVEAAHALITKTPKKKRRHSMQEGCTIF